jgi:hypothetical protein
MTQETILPTEVPARTPEVAATLKRHELAELQANEMSAALSLEDPATMVATVRGLRKMHARELVAWTAANR